MLWLETNCFWLWGSSISRKPTIKISHLNHWCSIYLLVAGLQDCVSHAIFDLSLCITIFQHLVPNLHGRCATSTHCRHPRLMLVSHQIIPHLTWYRWQQPKLRCAAGKLGACSLPLGQVAPRKSWKPTNYPGPAALAAHGSGRDRVHQVYGFYAECVRKYGDATAGQPKSCRTLQNHLGMAEIGVYPKWNSHLVGIMIINHPVWGYTIFRQTHLGMAIHQHQLE